MKRLEKLPLSNYSRQSGECRCNCMTFISVHFHLPPVTGTNMWLLCRSGGCGESIAMTWLLPCAASRSFILFCWLSSASCCAALSGLDLGFSALLFRLLLLTKPGGFNSSIPIFCFLLPACEFCINLRGTLPLFWLFWFSVYLNFIYELFLLLRLLFCSLWYSIVFFLLKIESLILLFCLYLRSHTVLFSEAVFVDSLYFGWACIFFWYFLWQ